MSNKQQLCSMHLNQMVYLVHLRQVISSRHPSLMVFFKSQLSLLRTQLVCSELNKHKTLSLVYSKPLRILKHNQTRFHLVKVFSTTKTCLTRTQKKQKVAISSEKPVLCSMDRTNRQSLKKSSQQSSNLLCLLARILR
jgi:hypothetical protein